MIDNFLSEKIARREATSKLRSHLGKTRGFTLVELLIVIAIIAILVLLVIVAIDPLERIRDANDRNAQNAVRQAGSAVMVCITKELARSADPFDGTTCNVDTWLLSEGYIQSTESLTGVTLTVSGVANICATHANTGGHNPPVTWNSGDTQVSDPETAAGVCDL